MDFVPVGAGDSVVKTPHFLRGAGRDSNSLFEAEEGGRTVPSCLACSYIFLSFPETFLTARRGGIWEQPYQESLLRPLFPGFRTVEWRELALPGKALKLMVG